MTAIPAGGKEVWLFTARFPRGNGEYWLDHELPYLCRKFKRVVIFPLYWEEGQRDLPENVVVHQTFKDPFITADWIQMLRHVRLWVPLVHALWISAPKPMVFLRRFREIVSRIRQALARTLQFRTRYMPVYDPGTVVMYSNWAEDWATILCLMRLDRPEVHFITRLHGFDLYDHRAKDQWQMFQRFNLRMAGHIYTTSHAARHDVIRKFPELAGQVSVSFTATEDHGIGPWEDSAVLRIVSCSNLYPIKRVHLIAEAIAGMEIPVHWVHFGDGQDRGRVLQALSAAGPHVQVDLKGAVPNEQVIAWYKRNVADVFVHVSSTEGGVAVAIQEACSFGIPVIGADAGGVKEIVNEQTGILLPNDLTSSMLRDHLLVFARIKGATARREQVRAFWRSRFISDVVNARFADDLYNR